MTVKPRTIAKLAAEAGVNVETVRYYQRIGILANPPPRRGGRLYSDDAVWLIRYVKVAQSWGLPLKTIASLLRTAELSANFCASVRSAAADRLADIDREIARMQTQRQEIADFITACAAKADSERCPIYRRLEGEAKAAKSR
jgi:MerR family mercuric resistance operon transcriptional regulator